MPYISGLHFDAWKPGRSGLQSFLTDQDMFFTAFKTTDFVFALTQEVSSRVCPSPNQSSLLALQRNMGCHLKKIARGFLRMITEIRRDTSTVPLELNLFLHA